MIELRIRLSEGTAAYTESVTVTADRFQRPDPVPSQQILGSAEVHNLRGVVPSAGVLIEFWREQAVMI